MVLPEKRCIEAQAHLTVELHCFVGHFQVGQKHGAVDKPLLAEVIETAQELLRGRESRDVHIGLACLCQNPAEQPKRMKADTQIRLGVDLVKRSEQTANITPLAHYPEV